MTVIINYVLRLLTFKTILQNILQLNKTTNWVISVFLILLQHKLIIGGSYKYTLRRSKMLVYK